MWKVKEAKIAKTPKSFLDITPPQIVRFTSNKDQNVPLSHRYILQVESSKVKVKDAKMPKLFLA